jgi:hypothetical protein
MTGEWHRAWELALDELEADVAQVEAMIMDDHRAREMPPAEPWSPPTGMGALPVDLRPRADQILTRQLAAAQAVSIALTANRKQAEAAARIEAGSKAEPLRPAYIDCAA